MTLISALGGGLFIIPLGFFIASVWSVYRAYIQWKSGSGGWEKDPRGVDVWVESDKKVPFFSIGATWFAIGFLVFSIGSLIWMISEK